jgi:(p)ppGpp synthase/HD superfamily hydrolase
MNFYSQLNDWGGLVYNARTFATFAHSSRNQVRKYTGSPYIIHPQAVAGYYGRHAQGQADGNVIAACLLHDVVEDTQFCVEDIMVLFGDTIGQLVKELTDVFTPENFPGLNRQTRKKLEAERYGHSISEDAQLIKLCDLIDNTSDIVQNAEKGFAMMYLEEKKYILEQIKTRRFGIWDTANNQVETLWEQLNESKAG